MALSGNEPANRTPLDSTQPFHPSTDDSTSLAKGDVRLEIVYRLAPTSPGIFAGGIRDTQNLRLAKIQVKQCFARSATGLRDT